ncbi:hypothetical protein G7050_07805 [Dysgonomonas sp. HDW5A]|uniref:DUF6625 family protein n=1 Tax=Dysgonomonas sp. HDW5A TaxID=2714926 RepID=UPI0014096270|nr:DUF6625 family protein [Dysgonomonas sp. HDW5A]QIK59741.1 hypothetical protein G7050_07805 [Dysgonomonas sp. HDW5A]
MKQIETYKYKIALVICWYGQLPWYWKYFVHSMQYNSTIDCILITDEKIEELLPSNIKQVQMSLSEIKTLAECKLGFPVSLDYPYKLCDFKPAYGLLFDELLTEYDFWGHGDLDVIFGNIRNFITDPILDNNDIISVRRDFLTGYFMLFRNNIYINNLFTKSKDYRKVYESPRSWCFDECNHMHLEIGFNKNSILNIDCDIDSMEHVVQREIESGNIKVFFDFMVVEGTPGNIKWEKGSLFYKNEYEILLYHFIAMKSIKNLYLPLWEKLPDIIEIGENFITSPSSGFVERLKLTARLKLDRIKWSTQILFRKKIVDVISYLKKKNEILNYNAFIGHYRKSHLSVIYEVLINKEYLVLRHSHHNGAIFRHIWGNVFITPDLRTIVKGKNIEGKFVLEIKGLNRKIDLFVKK